MAAAARLGRAARGRAGTSDVILKWAAAGFAGSAGCTRPRPRPPHPPHRAPDPTPADATLTAAEFRVSFTLRKFIIKAARRPAALQQLAAACSACGRFQQFALARAGTGRSATGCCPCQHFPLSVPRRPQRRLEWVGWAGVGCGPRGCARTPP